MRAAVIVATLVALAGCGTTQFDINGREWTKAGAQFNQTTQDEMECARQAVDARPFPDTFVGGIPDVVVVYMQDAKMKSDYARCMAGRGYQPARNQG